MRGDCSGVVRVLLGLLYLLFELNLCGLEDRGGYERLVNLI